MERNSCSGVGLLLADGFCTCRSIIITALTMAHVPAALHTSVLFPSHCPHTCVHHHCTVLAKAVLSFSLC